ncbi:MAG: dockerin type I repeat-containing protein [Phycisphaerales bacterium]|jgi:hypothetical protein
MLKRALPVVLLLAAAPCFAQELYRQSPIPNGIGGLSAQDARNPGGLGWFSEVVDDFPGQAGWSIGNVEFWGGYVTDIPGNTHGFTIRFYDGSDGVVGSLLSAQDVFTFTETEYYSVFFSGLGIVRGYHYTLDLSTPFAVPANGRYWISVTAILDRGGSANEPQWGWIPAQSISGLSCKQWFFSPGNFTPQNQDVSFVLNSGGGGGPSCDPDVNQDGNADSSDVDYLINVVAGGSNDTGIDPDFNGDGNVDSDDVSALLNVVAGGECP